MRNAVHRIILTGIMVLASSAVMTAGPDAAGCRFSLDGAGIVYRHELRKDVFYEVSVSIDYGHSVFVTRTSPGVWAKYGYNIVFAEKEYEAGTLKSYAGPGVMLGYTVDTFSSLRGLAGGLTGTIGMEYEFRKVPVILSLGITPCLGFLLRDNDGMRQMDFYFSGVTYSFLPEIGIRYSF